MADLTVNAGVLNRAKPRGAIALSSATGVASRRIADALPASNDSWAIACWPDEVSRPVLAAPAIFRACTICFLTVSPVCGRRNAVEWKCSLRN
jgi:hypothetical protein